VVKGSCDGPPAAADLRVDAGNTGRKSPKSGVFTGIIRDLRFESVRHAGKLAQTAHHIDAKFDYASA
jgi:hypothetical protein